MFCQDLLQSRQLFLHQQLPMRYLDGLNFHLVCSKMAALFLCHKSKRKGVVPAHKVMYLMFYLKDKFRTKRENGNRGRFLENQYVR